jgi:hypothetical protein
MVTEATIAYSDRLGFQVARWLSPWCDLGSGTQPRNFGWMTSHTPNAATSCGSAASSLDNLDFSRRCSKRTDGDRNEENRRRHRGSQILSTQTRGLLDRDLAQTKAPPPIG